jgi:hypothetical protein
MANNRVRIIFRSTDFYIIKYGNSKIKYPFLCHLRGQGFPLLRLFHFPHFIKLH